MNTCERMGSSYERNEDDEVEIEIDVFLSKSLADNLYLLHYPSRPALETPENVECLSAKVKPKQQKLELEFSLDTDTDNYDKSRGKQMAINVDGLAPSGEPYFRSDIMDKYILSGAQAGCTDNFAVGLIRKGELHITPLHSALELRQNFKYMDKMDSLAKKSLSAEEEEEEEEEAVAVTVRFEAEKDKQMREKSYQYLQQKNANEPWINVNYHPFNSHSSKQVYDKLICSHMYKDVTSCDFTIEDYRKSLVPECLRLSGYNSIRDQEIAVPMDQPISDQMKHLMINAHVLRFSTILDKMPSDVDIVSVERLVQQIAVLVQGCWVVKSELLYQEDSVSSLTGISGKYLVSVRDDVVWLFTKQRLITRQEVLSAIYVPHADLKCMISQIATKTKRGWEFKYPYDTQFVESHRSVEQSQDIKWNLRYKKLVKELNLGMCDPEGQIQKLPCPVLPRKQKRHSRSSLSEDGEESGTDTSTSSLRDSKSKRLNSPKKRMNVSSSKTSLKSVKTYHIATLDVSPTFLETSPSDEIKTQLKECVEEAIRSQFIMTLSDLKELVSDSHLNALCNRSDFEKLLHEALLSCGAQKLKNKDKTKNTRNETDFKHIYVYHDLSEPGAERILETEELMSMDDMTFAEKYGHSNDFSLADAFWACGIMFSNCKYTLAHRRILLFIVCDNPHAGNSQLQVQAKTKAKDLHDSNIDIELFPIKKSSAPFDYSSFYKDIILTAEDEQYTFTDPSERFDDLLISLLKDMGHLIKVQELKTWQYLRICSRKQPVVCYPDTK